MPKMDHVSSDVLARHEIDHTLRLQSIHGLNFANGLTAVRGNVAKYVILLNLFAKSYQKYSGQIQDLLISRKTPSLESIAYSLRGSAGMVGAQSVSTAANSVLSALRDGHMAEAEQHGGILANELSKLINSIQFAIADLGDPGEVSCNSGKRGDFGGSQDTRPGSGGN